MKGKVIALRGGISMKTLERLTRKGWEIVRYEHSGNGINRVWLYLEDWYDRILEGDDVW